MSRNEHFAAGAGAPKPRVSFRHQQLAHGVERMTAHHSELGKVGSIQYRDLGGELEVAGIEVDDRVQGLGVGTKLGELVVRKHQPESIVTDSLTGAGRRWGDALERRTGVRVESLNERYGFPDDYDDEDEHR